MPMIASLIKIAALAAALLCVGAVKPMSDDGPLQAASESKSPQLQCRIYFGCTPSARAAATTTRQ
jgi:hypothetical protein